MQLCMKSTIEQCSTEVAPTTEQCLIKDTRHQGKTMLMYTPRQGAPIQAALACAVLTDSGETNKLLKKHNVGNVVSCIACHDVPSIPRQAPQTSKFADAVWACSQVAITPHIHYRLVLDIVGKQLYEFASSHQLVTAVRDALIAHKDAYHNAGVLHQDLSVGNIVIHDGKGILIDWDLSNLINIKGARQVTRMGTLQFISADLIANRKTKHDVEDDLESSFYVVLWTALLCTKTHLTIPARSLLMKQVFEVAELEGVVFDTKSPFLISRSRFGSDVFVNRKPLDKLVLALAEFFAIRYKWVTQEEQNAYDQGCVCMEEAKLSATEMVLITNLWKANPAYKLKMYMEILKLHKLHDKIIEIYDSHLRLDGWPHQ
ncbi:hypothetical protein DFJ58DRAFT_706880 [Suillus subalutaceus]|uniref:uncharacterized protein n=1 Tax=Suillus subalutaceus TaxID=48586 RepID=UPI001B85E10E|nr:uncharacterized protein DFJ58DRAFT_706880 [Suillus subalutaceus]KAG1843477.1 hypothetical protein DFJ58DRAFT_706880 [Suillus subalutaceus]